MLNLSFSSISSRFLATNQALTPNNSTELSAQLKSAVFNGDISLIKGVITSNPELLNAPFSDGELPLHAAVRLQNSQAVDLLLTLGADSNLRDFQSLTALDYALVKKDVQMVRKLLPSQVVRQIDEAQARNFSLDPADPIEVENILEKIKSETFDDVTPELKDAICAGNVNQIQKWIGENHPITADDLSLALVKGQKEIALVFVSALDRSCYNQCNNQGISPMHLAAAMRDGSSLQAMVAKGGDVFERNARKISAVDILFDNVKNDPLKLSKTQLLLGLISLGGIIASSCIMPLASQETASYWSAGLFLISTGTDFALSYHAYCQLNPENVWSKVLYWTTALGAMPIHTMMAKVPGAKVVWDMWRMSTVCKRAFTKVKCAYQNCAYDTKRSLQLLGAELLTLGTSAYHVRESFYKIKRAWEDIYNLPESSKSQRQQLTREAKMKHPLLPYIFNQRGNAISKVNHAYCTLFGNKAGVDELIDQPDNKEVKKVFKEMALIYHPDKCSEDLKPMCADAFKRLKAALDTIKKADEFELRKFYWCRTPSSVF